MEKKSFLRLDNGLNFVFLSSKRKIPYFISSSLLFTYLSAASTPPTVLPASTIENIKDWSDLRSEMNGNNTIINGQIHLNSIHVSDKSMLIMSWRKFL